MDRPTIRLGQFLKWRGLVPSGGQAKIAIQDGVVRVNGVVELRRGRRLVTGDRVEFEGASVTVELDEAAASRPENEG